MKIKVKEGHTGIMTLKDETQVNYGIIRITQNLSKITFYTGKGLRELFKLDMNKEERANAAQLKKLDEKTLMKLGYVSEMPFSNIRTID